MPVQCTAGNRNYTGTVHVCKHNMYTYPLNIYLPLSSTALPPSLPTWSEIIFLSHTHFHFNFSLAYRIGHRVHTEWQWPLSGVHSIKIEKAAQTAQPGEGVGCTPTPLSPNLPSHTKLWCTLQLRGQIHSPIYLLYPYICK